MHKYHAKEQDKYRLEQNKGSIPFLLVGVTALVLFVPVAIMTVGSMRVYTKIREVLKK